MKANGTAVRLLIIGFVLLIALRLYGRRASEGFAGAAGKELVIVKAEWCGHCQKAMPEFKKLVAASPIKLADGSSVTVRMLDEKKDKATVDTMGVKGFPTILYIKDGQRIEYSGSRTADGVMGFLQSA